MEQSRDERLIRARSTNQSYLENLDLFEQHTVDPILQFQSSLIYSQVKHQIRERFKAFNAWNQQEQKKIIRQLLAQEIALRKSLIHTITSLFTLEEFKYYQRHEYELNKRMTKRIEIRLHRNLEKLL